MRALVVAIGLGAALVASSRAQPPAAGAETPDWVAQQIEHRNTGRDARLEMTMRLFDRQGRVRERTLVMTSLRGSSSRALRPFDKLRVAPSDVEGRQAQGVPSGSRDGDRVLVRFLSPGDIKGTGLLVWEHENAEDERFLYLPALGRVRRIAGSEKQESFAGSDLSYEDIGGREIGEYTYAFVERDATWIGPDGRAYPAWRLESNAKDQQTSYPRAVSLVRKDSFVVAGADVFNRRNEREKRYEVRHLELIDNIWTATNVVMTNDVQKTRTELVVTKATYNVGLTEADFSRRALEQATR